MSTNRVMSERPVNLLKQFLTTTIASLAALAAAPALAQEATPAEPAAADTQQTRQHAVQNMSLLMSALNSEQVEQQVKNVLMSCIYSNSMQEITVAMDRAIAANPDRFDRSDSSVMLGVMASICGFQPPAAATGEAGEAPAEPR